MPTKRERSYYRMGFFDGQQSREQRPVRAGLQFFEKEGHWKEAEEYLGEGIKGYGPEDGRGVQENPRREEKETMILARPSCFESLPDRALFGRR